MHLVEEEQRRRPLEEPTQLVTALGSVDRADAATRCQSGSASPASAGAWRAPRRKDGVPLPKTDVGSAHLHPRLFEEEVHGGLNRFCDARGCLVETE